jgi:hypothetical protein
MRNSDAPPHYAKAFLSYVHDPPDEEVVQRLAAELRKQGITVFLDRDSLIPGQAWEPALTQAIRQGSYFIACFSANFNRRPDSYMAKELAVALAEMKQGVQGEGWFVPLRLDDVRLPQLDIGNNRSLQDLQWIDLFGDWNAAIHRLFRAVRHPGSIDPQVEAGLRDLCSSHIGSKIARFKTQGQLRIPELENRWLSLLHPIVWTPTVELFLQLFNLAQESGIPQTDQCLDRSQYNRSIAITAATVIDARTVLRHLDVAAGEKPSGQPLFKRFLNLFSRSRVGVKRMLPNHPYARFVARRRAELRTLPDWTNRDFVHWIFCENDREMQIDLLYSPSFTCEVESITFERYLKKQGKSFLPHGDIYPTSLVSGSVMARTVEHVLQQDALVERAAEH